MRGTKMPTYEQKLTEFARGKRFLRLPRPIRDRADALCDACDSTRPHTLYGLEDTESKRHFFVGDTCLKGLVKLGAILRYGRHSGQAQFENEMRLRSLEHRGDQYASLTSEGALEPIGPEDGSNEHRPGSNLSQSIQRSSSSRQYTITKPSPMGFHQRVRECMPGGTREKNGTESVESWWRRVSSVGRRIFGDLGRHPAVH